MSKFVTADIEKRYRELPAMSVPNRQSGTANFRRATEWVRDFVKAAAPAAVVRFDEQGGYRNIEISIKGTDPAAGIYSFGGHLDSRENTQGMDDNASGSVAAAIVGSVLGQYRFKAEIRALVFDGEEIQPSGGGLHGSRLYVQALKASGCMPTTCLKIFINMDMVGFDPSNRLTFRILSDVTAMQMLHQKVNTDYMLGLTLNLGSGSCHSSDDCSFSGEGYPAVGDVEGSSTPYRHTPGDTIETLNFVSITKYMQLVSGVVATAAVPVGRAAP